MTTDYVGMSITDAQTPIRITTEEANLSSNNRRTSSEESEWQTEDEGSRTRDRTSNVGSGGTNRRRNQGSSSNLPDRSTCGFQVLLEKPSVSTCLV
jgi:hypothetical protein